MTTRWLPEAVDARSSQDKRSKQADQQQGAHATSIRPSRQVFARGSRAVAEARNPGSRHPELRQHLCRRGLPHLHQVERHVGPATSYMSISPQREHRVIDLFPSSVKATMIHTGSQSPHRKNVNRPWRTWFGPDLACTIVWTSHWQFLQYIRSSLGQQAVALGRERCAQFTSLRAPPAVGPLEQRLEST
jgi:hypothetical protein